MADFVEYHGEKFWLQTTGRYFQSGDKTKPERLLHRRIWIDNHGAIPDGFAVHHIDGNWQNNSLENLEIMPAAQHARLHMFERWQDEKHAAKFKVGIQKAREAAKDWHASPEGLEWHSQNGKALWVDRKRVQGQKACEHCGGAIFTYFPTRTKFCSRKCDRNNNYRTQFTAQRNCKHCSAQFVANKYRKTEYCSRACSNRARSG